MLFAIGTVSCFIVKHNISIDGTGLERLTFNNTFDSFPMLSPDGRKLAFGSNRNPQRPRETDIYIADWVE